MTVVVLHGASLGGLSYAELPAGGGRGLGLVAVSAPDTAEAVLSCEGLVANGLTVRMEGGERS